MPKKKVKVKKNSETVLGKLRAENRKKRLAAEGAAYQATKKEPPTAGDMPIYSKKAQAKRDQAMREEGVPGALKGRPPTAREAAQRKKKRKEDLLRWAIESAQKESKKSKVKVKKKK